MSSFLRRALTFLRGASQRTQTTRSHSVSFHRSGRRVWTHSIRCPTCGTALTIRPPWSWLDCSSACSRVRRVKAATRSQYELTDSSLPIFRTDEGEATDPGNRVPGPGESAFLSAATLQGETVLRHSSGAKGDRAPSGLFNRALYFCTNGAIWRYACEQHCC